MNSNALVRLVTFVAILPPQAVRLGVTATADFEAGYNGQDVIGTAGIGIWAAILEKKPDKFYFEPKVREAKPDSYYQLWFKDKKERKVVGLEALRMYLGLSSAQVQLLARDSQQLKSFDFNPSLISHRIMSIVDPSTKRPKP